MHSLGMHAKFQAMSFHGFGVTEETHTDIYLYRLHLFTFRLSETLIQEISTLIRTLLTQWSHFHNNVKMFFFLFLWKARAKLELREEATKEDAEDVVKIMKHRCIMTKSKL